MQEDSAFVPSSVVRAKGSACRYDSLRGSIGTILGQRATPGRPSPRLSQSGAACPMLPAMSISDDPVARYLQTFEELRARKRWSTQSVTFRFVALSLGAAASTIGYDRLEEAATDLRTRARWFSPLKSEIRYVVAAMILRRGLDTARIHERVFATRDADRKSVV